MGLVTPVTQYMDVTPALYAQHGEFSHKAYTVDQSTSTPAIIFPQITESLEMLFSYSGPAPEPVTIKVYLIDTNGSWQKEIPVQTTGANPVSFPLDINYLLTIGNTINKELGGRGNGYLVRITAQVGDSGTPFTLTLDGSLDANILTWDDNGFLKVERGFPGDDTIREAVFGYRVKLKDNSLYGPVTLERSAEIPKPVEITPETLTAAGMAKFADINFNYKFTASESIRSLEEDVKLTLTITETGAWTKTFELDSTTQKDGGAVQLSVPLDIDALVALVDSYDEAAGNRSSIERQITITAEVHTLARMDSGVANETFVQQLNGTIGKTITWADTDKTGADQLTLIKEGKISRTIAQTMTGVKNLRLVSFILMIISTAACATLLVVYLRTRPAPTLRDALKKDLKKHGELISEVADLAPMKEGNILIPVNSLEELVKIANNSLKPVLLKVDPEKLTYRVIDRSTIYEYINKAVNKMITGE